MRILCFLCFGTKLAILSAVPEDFLRVSVSPVSGKKCQDPPGQIAIFLWLIFSAEGEAKRLYLI